LYRKILGCRLTACPNVSPGQFILMMIFSAGRPFDLANVFAYVGVASGKTVLGRQGLKDLLSGVALLERLFLIITHPAGPLVDEYPIHRRAVLRLNLGLEGIAFILNLPEF
jgi:hypothetical protein